MRIQDLDARYDESELDQEGKDDICFWKNREETNTVKNDTLFFCKANPQSMFAVKAMLNYLELASGLKVNYMKSRIGGLRCNKYLLKSCATILNCEVMKIPFQYLGCLSGGVMKEEVFGKGWWRV